ncbi:MAG: hypothetical protein N2515_02310, partial [Deltaproteobacteria bacterium]|nr:hypothetical protein [Deltaproteobacteria bacterium]
MEKFPRRYFVIEWEGDRPTPIDGESLRWMVNSCILGLRKRGVRPGDRVILLASNAARWVACDLAILA